MQAGAAAASTGGAASTADKVPTHFLLHSLTDRRDEQTRPLDLCVCSDKATLSVLRVLTGTVSREFMTAYFAGFW